MMERWYEKNEIITEKTLPLETECKMKATLYRNKRTEGHISRKEPSNLCSAWIFSAEKPQYKSWIIYCVFPFGADVQILMFSIQITATLTPEIGLPPKDTMYEAFSLWDINTKHCYGRHTQAEDTEEICCTGNKKRALNLCVHARTLKVKFWASLLCCSFVWAQSFSRTNAVTNCTC